MAGAGASRGRDADRSRVAILDAAEELFARKGFEATSLEEVGRSAGLSRGTPRYFFGSKEDLYGAVLERVFADARGWIARGRAGASGGTAEEAIAEAVGSYMDFLASRPAFVRLAQWEALTGGRSFGETPPHLAFVRYGLAAVGEELSRGTLRAADPAQILIDIVSLCFFPLAHADSFLKALGVDTYDPDFFETRKRHVVDLVLRGLLPAGAEGGDLANRVGEEG